MNILFSDLVKIYRKANFDTNKVGYADFFVENADELDLIKNLTTETNSRLTNIGLIKDSLAVGRTIRLAVSQPNTNLGWLYKDLDEFLTYNFIKKPSESTPYFIKDIKFYSEDLPIPPLIQNYNVMKNLLAILIKVAVYHDTNNNKLIFAGKNTFELDYNVKKKRIDFISFLSNLELEKHQAITEFCDWIDDDSSKHLTEKKSILASILEEKYQEQELNILNILGDIELLNKLIKSQYLLYLEDFKYEKFVKKLEENTEKFITRINESINKVLSQILALPIAMSAPAILNGLQPNLDNSKLIIAYIGLLAYSIICYFALDVQKEILENVKYQTNNFELKGKIPQALVLQWREDKKQIETLVVKQYFLYWIMLIVISFAIIFSVYKTIDILAILFIF